jgi:hypothetical protein
MSIPFHAPFDLRPEKQSNASALNRALAGHNSLSEAEKKPVPLPLQELQFLGSLARNLITISTELISLTHIV